MEWIIPIVTLLAFSGLLFFFRWMDSKNADVRELKTYVKSVESEIDQYLRRKMKVFDDKIIPAELAVDRMNNLAQTLQKKAEEFVRVLDEGDKLFMDLHQEMGDISDSLKDYKRIRGEFQDIERKIAEIVSMRNIVAQGSDELETLRSDMSSLKKEYDTVMTDLTEKSKGELQLFFQTMQNDLTEHLSSVKNELSDRDGEINGKIEELRLVAADVSHKLVDFKDNAEAGIAGLTEQFQLEMTVLRGAAEANAEEIIDRWNTLKEQTYADRELIENTVRMQNEIFDVEKANIRKEIEGIKTSLDIELAARIQKMDESSDLIQDNLKLLENNLKTNLELGLDEKISGVRRELEQTQQAFAAQEESLAQKLNDIAQKAEARINTCETAFRENLDSLTDRVHAVAEKADKILYEAEGKIEVKMQSFTEVMRSKVDENIERLEDSFTVANEERLHSSLNDITKSLEEKYIKQYDESFQTIVTKSQVLDEQVKTKLKDVDALEKHLEGIQKTFTTGKDDILFMVRGLEENRSKNIQEIKEELYGAAEILQNNLQNEISTFFEHEMLNQRNEQQIWSQRYEETISEARVSFGSIREGIDEINRFLQEVEKKTFATLKEDINSLTEDASRRLEDLKKDADIITREGKENFKEQVDQAKESLSKLKQELWDSEGKVRDQVQRDLIRLNDRIKESEKNFQAFMKKTEMLERAESLAEKFHGRMQEMEDLKKDLTHTAGDLIASQNSGREIITSIESQTDDLKNQLSSLESNIEHAKHIQDDLKNTVVDVQKLSDFYAHIEQEREKALVVEELLMKNLERYNDLHAALDELESRKSKVDEMLASIESVNLIMHNTADVTDKIADLDSYAGSLQRQLTEMQAELHSAINDQSHVRGAIDKLSDLESITYHLDTEMKRVEKMLEFVAKSSNMLEKSGGGSVFAANENSDEQIKSVLRLYRQNWSIKEIADKLKLSPAWVELMIEKNK